MSQPQHNKQWAIALSIGLLGLGITGCNTPSDPTVTATDSPSPTAAPTTSPTESPSPTASPTTLPTESPSLTASPSPTGSPTTSPSATASPTSKAAIETQLATLVSQTAAIAVQSVTCPADLTEKAGTRYDCQVQSDIGSFVVVVQPTGEAGKFNWGTRGLLLVSKLNAFIQQSVASRGGGVVTVDCGAQARAAKPGDVFECKVTDAKGAVKTARVTVRDDQGNVYLSGL